MFRKLLCEGNFRWNEKVLKSQKGELMLLRRPNRGGIPVTSFLPCPGCKGLKADLEMHCARCPFVKPLPDWLPTISVRAEVMVGRFEPDQQPQAVSGMKNQAFKEVVKGDFALMGYAKYTEESKGTSKVQEKTLKHRLAKLSELLLGVREKQIILAWT